MMTLNLFSYGQKLVDSGSIAEIVTAFKGPEEYPKKGDLTHALAYTHSKDIVDVYAGLKYQVTYQVNKIPHKGFETTITIHPAEKEGHYLLYDFDFSEYVFPQLKSLKLYYKNKSAYMYVKPIILPNKLKDSFTFTFRHQRYSDDWELSLGDLQWQEKDNEKEFNKRWALVNDYQTTHHWLMLMDEIELPNALWEQLMHHLRWAAIFDQIKQMEFYQQLIISNQEDPLLIQEKIAIESYKLERDIEALQNTKTAQEIDLDKCFETYFNLEKDLIWLSDRSNTLYGDLYFEFDPLNREHFCLDETYKILENSPSDSAIYLFEYSIQEQSLAFISKLIEEKRANEALFQIQRFHQFYNSSQYLSNSPTFFQFKAKAVYDIYLSYIQVSRQAFEHHQIYMAINYLDKASDIQKQYPSEIINNMQVERQWQELVKKAMNRYQDLLDKEDYENAKQVKEGILGLMKKLGLNKIELPKGNS